MSDATFDQDHRWAPDQFSALLDGELGDSARRRLERHLADCDECRRVLAGLRAMLAALQGLAIARTPSSEAAQIATAVRAQLGDPPPHRT